jgi:hypothetical protein
LNLLLLLAVVEEEVVLVVVVERVDTVRLFLVNRLVVARLLSLRLKFLQILYTR